MNATTTAANVFTYETLPNGKFCIRHGEVVIRKQSARLFETAYVYGNGWVRLAPDSQMLRCSGGKVETFPIVARNVSFANPVALMGHMLSKPTA